MKMNVQARLAGLVAGLILVCGLAGCVSQAKQENRMPMVVGIVHMDRVLPEIPAYRDLSEKYETERLKLFEGLKAPQDPKALQEFMQDAKKKQEIEKSVQKWDEARRQFVDKTMDEVRAAAEKVARDKDVDIVLVDAPWYPVRERLAVDVTTDVIITLKESGKAAR